MRRYTALVGLTLLVFAMVARVYESSSHAEPAQAAVTTGSPWSVALATPTPATQHITLARAEVTTRSVSGRDDVAAVTLAPARSDATATREATATARPTDTATPAPTVTATHTAPATATSSPLPPAATTAPTATPGATATQGFAPPDRLIADSIGLDTSVVPVGWHEVKNADGSTEKNADGSTDLEWDVASNGAGWHWTSAAPGEVGNMVIAGHSNIDGEVFRNLADLKKGDLIKVDAGGREFRYVVTDTFILADKNVPYEQRLENARWIGPFPDERLTLLTCWPPNNNTHRAFVIAKPLKEK